MNRTSTVQQMGTLLASLVAVLLVAGALVQADDAKPAASAAKAAAPVVAKDAKFVEVIPGVSKHALWGDAEKGPYGAFTRFKADLKNPLHTHSSEIHIVVLEGAYIYTPAKGDAVRVGPGQFFAIPANAPHVSAGDAKEGALFYEESQGAFDLKEVK